MNIADWIILLVLVVSVIQAASSGFFQEAFGIAGLVFGYLIAAWQYRRLAGHFRISSLSCQDFAGTQFLLCVRRSGISLPPTQFV